MASRVLFTVDCELTHRRYANGCSWQENLARSYDPAGVGITYQLKRLADFDLKACFFVDPMPALLYGLGPVQRMVEPILAANQEVQLHLHSFWAAAAEGADDGETFELTAFDYRKQLAMIRKARDLLMLAGAPNPIAFRAGSYAANQATLKALATLGFRYDSSHNGSQAPWLSALPLARSQIAPVPCDEVVEVPISLIEDRPGSLRHLQVCAVSSREMSEALLHASDRNHPVVTIVSHSFELACRDGLRPNAVLRNRFETLCAFLAAHRDQLPTAHFSEIGNVALDAEACPLPPRRLRTAGRMVQQLVSNLMYERRL